MITSNTRVVQYAIAYPFGASFVIPFKYWASGEIHAVLSFDDGTADLPLVISTDYTLSAPGDSGTLTKVSDWDHDAVRLTIYREVDLEQNHDLRNGETVDLDLLERDLDYSVARDQQIAEENSRAVTVPITDEAASNELPGAGERANTFLAFDAAGAPIPAAGMASVPVTPFMETLLDDTDADAALATLGLTVSVFAKTLLDDASAADARKTLGAGVETSALAGEALAVGDPVGLIQGRWAKAKWTERQDVLVDSGTITYHAECAGDDEGEFMLVYHDGGTSYAVLYRVEFDGTLTSVATGTPAAHYPLAVCKIGTGKYVMACRDLGTPTTIRFTVLTVSGASISEGAVQTKTNLSGSVGVDAAAIREGFADDEFACAYCGSTAANVNAVAGTVSGTTITLGTAVAVSTINFGQLRGAMSRFRIDGNTWFGMIYPGNTTGVASAFLFKQSGTTVTLSTGAGVNAAVITFGATIANLGAIAASDDNDMRMYAIVGDTTPTVDQQVLITFQICPHAAAGTPRDPGVIGAYEGISAYSGFAMARGVLIGGERVFTLTFSTGLSEVVATVIGASGGGVARVIRKTFPLLAAQLTSQTNGTLVAWGGRVIFPYLDTASDLYVMVIDIPDAIGIVLESVSAGDPATVAVNGLVEIGGFGNGKAYGVDYDTGAFKAGLIPEVLRSVGTKVLMR